MRSVISAMAIIFLALAAAPLGSQVVPPVDANEPVRLTLDECVSMALDNNPELEVKKAGVDVAQGQLIQAKAARNPTLKVTGNAVRSNQLPDFGTGDDVTLFPTGVSIIDPNDPASVSSPQHYHLIGFPSFEMSSDREGDIYGVKIEAQYALYTGGKIKKGVKAADLNKKAAEQEVRQSKNELIFNVEQAFYNLLWAQEMQKVVDAAYDTVAAHLGQVEALYKEGLVSNLDVLEVKAQLASIRPRQIQIKNGVKMARLGLNNYLNIDLETPVQAVGELKYTPHVLPVPEDLYTRALTARPEALIMELRIEMARKLHEIARANAYPTLALFGNYSWDRGQDMPPNDKQWMDGYQAGIVATMPLYDGRETEGKVAEAYGMLQQAEKGKRALELGIKTQVQMALLDLKAAREAIEAQEENVAAAEKNHEAAKARYSVGLASNLDVMDAQTRVTQAKGDYLTAVKDYVVAYYKLQAALGMPEEKDVRP